MKLKTFAIALLIIAGISHTSLKGYVYFKVKGQVDKLVQTAEPLIEIRYASIGSTLDGTIQIDGIVVRPRAVNDSVQIERLNLITPNLQFLLNGADSVRTGELPERLGLEIVGTRLNLYGELMKMLEKRGQAYQTSSQLAGGDVCFLGGNNVFAQYRELGLRELVIDGGVMIKRPTGSTEMQIDTSFSSRGIDQSTLSVTLEGVGNQIMQMAASIPLLKKMSISYQPTVEFGHNFLEYCSKRNGIEIPAYISQLFAKEDSYFSEALGFIPGPGIRNAMKQFMETHGEVRITAEPSSSLDISTIHLYKPEDWPNLFGLSISVGGAPITDLSFHIPEDEISGEDTESQQTKPKDVAQSPSTETPRSEIKKSIIKSELRDSRSHKRLGYYVVNKSDISKLVQKDVRILTAQGYRPSGRVLSVNNDIVTLKQRIKGGSLSTDVTVASIRKIEVFGMHDEVFGADD